MVMPLINEHKPKCHLCLKTFEDVTSLEIHQEKDHREFYEFHQKKLRKEPAPGDVTVF